MSEIMTNLLGVEVRVKNTLGNPDETWKEKGVIRAAYIGACSKPWFLVQLADGSLINCSPDYVNLSV